MLTELDGDVWRITLDRPDAGNALTTRLALDLAAAFLDRPEGTRAVLLLGNGPRFCVGGDVRTFADAEDLAAVRAMVRTRGLVRRAATRTLDDQLDDEAQLIAESAADPEGREGVRALVEKRPPDFRAAC